MMQLSTLLTLLPLFLAPSLVSAHGVVRDITIAGKKYTGPEPRQGFRDPGSSIIRQVEDTSPVKGANNPAMSCGTNSARASQVADVNPGDEIAFNWGSWPHRVGPLITYMASCGSTPCSEFDSANAKWFKIDQKALKDNGGWYQADVADGAPATAKIPSNLAPGNYLIRHEIIALHVAMSQGGAEFYPSCSQVRVGGSGTGAPSGDELVSFPGAYTDNHPGILMNAFGNVAKYDFPGPAVAKLAGGGGGGNANPAPAPAPTTSSAPAAPTATAPVNNGGAASPTAEPSTPAPPAATPSTSNAAATTSSRAEGAPSAPAETPSPSQEAPAEPSPAAPTTQVAVVDPVPSSSEAEPAAPTSSPVDVPYTEAAPAPAEPSPSDAAPERPFTSSETIPSPSPVDDGADDVPAVTPAPQKPSHGHGGRPSHGDTCKRRRRSKFIRRPSSTAAQGAPTAPAASEPSAAVPADDAEYTLPVGRRHSRVMRRFSRF
ncbi:endoglucanase-4 [Coprinopsis cinerea okayama7|uniref:lytic cellulose monooxygenase (C4-dehydrogenating) n=1 Tax=Coprinopsis cinerea (strain Okayama-7 / 130 / ATCC MYA-4618 / FGSC 9003) TaxID=240176 RepID=A8NLT0_COPC7|nr:endoglucanase-4 [Coprinopsis cinerea okayama7\|eukprot:XP_001834768.1 endoglucanase-4 [Coprinopsis cinerea okayama7\